MKTLVLRNTIDGAAEIIRRGGLAVVPTETVYGLAGNGLDAAVVEKLYEAKGRPANKPISLFVSDMRDAERFCRDIPAAAYALAEKFWPGPLTMVLRRRENVPDILTSGGDTVGVRCPDSALTLALLRECGVPLTGTSANLSGKPNAVTFGEALACFDGAVECAVDGGDCPGGVPSTVIDMTAEPPRILRPGGLPREEIEAVIGPVGAK